MFKNYITTFSILFLCFGTFAQTSTTLEIILDNITSEEENRQSNSLKSVQINRPYLSHTFDHLKILKKDRKNFRLTEHSDAFHLQIVVRNGQLKGFVLDENKEFGYKLSQLNDSLIYRETPTEELIFICPIGNEANHEHHDEHKHTHKTQHQKLGNLGDVTDPLLLESRPGATNLIYIDYDGESSLPGWESYHYNAADPQIPEIEKIKIWESMAEDFLPFDVNVTNNRTLFDSHPELDKCMLVVAQFGIVGWRGVAFLESFGTGKAALMDAPSHYHGENSYLYRTGAHEIGHTLGLKHDGGTTGEYYSGHGEYTPIMGNGDRPVAQWSNGDYPSATNFQDDINIMNNWIGTVPDDHATVTELIVQNTDVFATDNFGSILTRNDLDTFRITLPENGNIRLSVSSPIADRTNLDVNLQLLGDDKSSLITTSSPIGNRSGYIDETVDAGTYYLVIDGRGELTTADGFSDYGSLGYYEITGHVGYIAPICEFELENGAICLGDPLIVSNHSFGSDLTYSWSLENDQTFQSSDITPQVSFQTGGNEILHLTISNNAGTATCSSTIKIGDHALRLSIPKHDLDTTFTASLHYQQTTITPLTYTDFIQSGDYVYYDFCLPEDCYSITLNNVFLEETCGHQLWSDRYAFQGNDRVVFLGKIYRAAWWTKGDLPTGGSPWIYEGECLPTNDTTRVALIDLDESDTLFQTNPKDFGTDLYQTSNFCVGALETILVNTSNPNTCGTVEFVLNSQISGSSISWDFGLNASPQVANGAGPHQIHYSTPGTKNIDVDIDGITNTSEAYISDCVTGHEQENIQEYQIFPNPTSNVLHIHGQDIQETRLLDLSGYQWLKNDQSTHEHHLDLSDIANGVYILLIKTDQGDFVEKIYRRN